jgi:hypothetical protein
MRISRESFSKKIDENKKNFEKHNEEIVSLCARHLRVLRDTFYPPDAPKAPTSSERWDNRKLLRGARNPKVHYRVLKPHFTLPSLTRVDQWIRFVYLVHENDFKQVGKCF